MLPVNIAKGKCLTRSLGDLLVMTPQQSPLTAIRYSPYPLPAVTAAPHQLPQLSAAPHQLSQLSAAGNYNNVITPVSLSVPMLPTLPMTDMSSSQTPALPGMLSLLPSAATAAAAAKHSRTAAAASLAPQSQITNLGYNVNDLINIQNLQQRADAVPAFSFPLGF